MSNKPLTAHLENKKIDEIQVSEKTNTNFKEIRKKFENLSGCELNNESIKPPVAPLRKNRNGIDLNVKKLEKTHLSEPFLQSGVRAFQSNCVSTPKKLISVKERTKLFESNSDIKCENQTALLSNVSECINDVTSHTYEASKIKLTSSNNKTDLGTPPTKPPRTFTSNDKQLFQKSVISRKNSTSNIEDNFRIKKNQDNNNDSKPRTSSSFSFESNSSKDAVKSSRLLSAPEINVKIGNGDSTLKTPALNSKTHGLRNYFKNLSNTANNICEKVKQSKVFVDLTPTTVSPPKHYSTLKRSRSEEHIYAEPFVDGKNNGKSAEKPKENNEPLHYMCTPLIKPEVPEKKVEGSVFSRQSVRNMIYDSFAPLRFVPKDNQDSKIGDGFESDASQKAIQARIIYVKSIRQISGSSICIAPKLYEALYIINISESQPEVSHSFPLKVPNEYKFSLLPHICFPDAQFFKSVSVYQSETFHFTLFDKGEKVFGYCLRITGWPKNSSNQNSLCVKLPVAICIISQFNTPLFYSKLLSELEKHLTLPREKCFKYIRSIQKLGVPNAGASVSIPDYSESSEEDRVIISRPLDCHSVGFELTRALQLLDVDILVKAVASLLLERRVLLFSFSPSPFLLCDSTRELAMKHVSEFPIAASMIDIHLYRDDFLASTESETHITMLYHEIKDLMILMKLPMEKWATNSLKLKDVIQTNKEFQKSTTFVLGIDWDTNDDTLGYAFKTSFCVAGDKPLLKRWLLCCIASCYDPLELFLPFTIIGKILFQDAWILGIKWDELLPTNLSTMWYTAVKQLDNICSIKISCYIGISSHTPCIVHMFCDASERAYGSVL
ncbi:suppression of tumorigenicity 5 protein [Nephila pilipes]|uniref:Suppression of tumorigenicity 5 protein n=1 Tax=Nephila pilipes TaxID=299642 RepID=A0A8X6QNH6_NEPPI|nr:suppression of tumorigenicity 5 protein [Nephila pilipes]